MMPHTLGRGPLMPLLIALKNDHQRLRKGVCRTCQSSEQSPKFITERGKKNLKQTVNKSLKIDKYK